MRYDYLPRSRSALSVDGAREITICGGMGDSRRSIIFTKTHSAHFAKYPRKQRYDELVQILMEIWRRSDERNDHESDNDSAPVNSRRYEMTNFRTTLLATGISIALGFSAGAWAEADSNDNFASFSVAADASNEAEIDDESDGAIAIGGGNATHDQSEAYADDKSAAANNGGTATVDNSENSSATGGADAASALNGGTATIDKRSFEIDVSSQRAYGGVANHDGNVEFESTAVNLEGEIEHVFVTPIGFSLEAGVPVTASANSIDNSVNGAAGIIQISQNLGHASLVQQNTNVFGTVNVRE